VCVSKSAGWAVHACSPTNHSANDERRRPKLQQLISLILLCACKVGVGDNNNNNNIDIDIGIDIGIDKLIHKTSLLIIAAR
jgi:hypothetical protein